LRIFGCYEAPPTCRAIEEEYETTEKVPVAWEEQTVTKTRVRWECDDNGPNFNQGAELGKTPDQVAEEHELEKESES
jgi:hypothetical protein